MHLAHVTATFPPYRGGTGNVCYHNALELARRGHDVHVFTQAVAGAPTFEVTDKVTVHRLPPLVRVGNGVLLPGLARALRGFDVVHLHYPFFGGETAALATWRSHTPLVITYHQDVILSGAKGIVERIQRHTTGRLTLRSASRVLFTSRDYGRASVAQAALRGREGTVDELPNGVDLQAFRTTGPFDDLALRYQLGPEDHIVLLVASLDTAHRFKGVDVLLEALASLPDSVKSVIVGDGDMKTAYTAMAERLGLGSRVIFAGRVTDAELPNYYRSADVTVLPSTTMGEAFGLVLLESMASGTPVIAANLPGVRTVVAHGKDGLLIEPRRPESLATAVSAMLADDQKRIEMGRHGRAKVERLYDWAQIGQRLEAIYRDVLAGKQPVGLAI